MRKIEIKNVAAGLHQNDEEYGGKRQERPNGAGVCLQNGKCDSWRRVVGRYEWARGCIPWLKRCKSSTTNHNTNLRTPCAPRARLPDFQRCCRAAPEAPFCHFRQEAQMTHPDLKRQTQEVFGGQSAAEVKAQSLRTGIDPTRFSNVTATRRRRKRLSRAAQAR